MNKYFDNIVLANLTVLIGRVWANYKKLVHEQ